MEIFDVTKIKYEDRKCNLDVSASGEVKSTKFFPVYTNKEGKEEIFKPLSKTKPLSTPLFAYSEVYWSYLTKKYFDANAPLYRLAICEGIGEEQPKYKEIGTLVESVITPEEKLVNLLEYYREHPDREVDIDKYTNYCMKNYDYVPMFKSEVFSRNSNLSKQLAKQVLLSTLRRDQNFHYENVSFVYPKGKGISLIPPKMAATIDNEFSSMFLYADNTVEKEVLQIVYDQRMQKGILHNNIELIAKRHPDVVIEFISGLKNMREGLEKNPIVLKEEEGYIGEFSSEDYRIGYARWKEKNEEEATKQEKTILPMRTRIDLADFSNQLKNETFHSADILEKELCIYIEKDKNNNLVR